MSPLTSPPSPRAPDYCCGFRVCSLHPSSSLFTHADTRRSLPCPTVRQRCPIKKGGWTPTYLGIINHPVWNRRPLNPTHHPTPLSPGLTRQAVAHCRPPLSPIVLSSFSGCNCSTINSGGKENAVSARIEAELRGRKEDGDKRNCKRSPCAISLLLYCCIVSRTKSTSTVAAEKRDRSCVTVWLQRCARK